MVNLIKDPNYQYKQNVAAHLNQTIDYCYNIYYLRESLISGTINSDQPQLT